MPDAYHEHLGAEAIECFVFGELAETELAPVEEHLLVCERCRQAVTEMDVFAPLIRPCGTSREQAAFVHATDEGPVTLEIRALPGSRWLARFYGARLEGESVMESAREACACLRRSFTEMFPEHLCSKDCGPLD